MFGALETAGPKLSRAEADGEVGRERVAVVAVGGDDETPAAAARVGGRSAAAAAARPQCGRGRADAAAPWLRPRGARSGGAPPFGGALINVMLVCKGRNKNRKKK